MMWLHPFIQSVAMILAVWVLYMGIQRFRFQHMHVKTAFNWKRHVLLGKIVNCLWLAGAGLGLFMAWHSWGSVNLTGGHFFVGVTMVPLILVSLTTGLILEKPKGKRTGLALVHGCCNTLLFLLGCYQVWSAVEVIELFLLD